MERALNGMTLSELEQHVARLGAPRFRARQLYHFLHAEGGRQLAACTVLSEKLRVALESTGSIRRASVAHTLRSALDGTTKYLLRMEDGAHVEAVWMPSADRDTVCISTQVGCKMGCKFCASTKAQFERNLLAEEMLEEVRLVEQTAHRLDHLVLMGIGEPLDNYEEVVRFLRLLTDADGRNFRVRGITLSTAGLVPKIMDLAEENLPINLAISLHASSDATRRKTMPVARRYSMASLVDAANHYFDRTGRRVSFEYALIAGENDSSDDLNRLARLLRGPRFHVNLIALNPIREYDKISADYRHLTGFADALRARGVHATIRQKRGADIDAACGQLRIAYEQRR